MPRNRNIDRALNTSGKGQRIATAVVVLLGAVVLLWVVSPTERKRRTAMRDVELGDDTTEVVRSLGQPVRCSGRALEVIRPGFPRDWPPPSVESALNRLQEATAQRWVYAISTRKRLTCNTRQGRTEIGVGRDGRVLWYIAVTGKTNIRVPDEYSPSSGGS